MRASTLLVSLLLVGSLAAAEPASPFAASSKAYDPAVMAPWTVARDGTVAAATPAAGDALAGEIDLALWAGDNQAGGRGMDGVNLFGPAGENAWIGLQKDWRIGEGTDGGGPWVYYTKFQQDALIVMGFAACDAASLPTADGAGFAIHDAQPFDRVLLVLPWRWVQGGGSAYQTGAYNGNPPQAGVWAVPAGMSLDDAEKQAGTCRLSDLKPLLKEVQPHLWSSAYKLQVSAAGGWEVSVDIDGDGQVDHRTHGLAAGNKPNPFAGMDESSGLIISARSAMGNHTGTVGRTDVTLSYRMVPIQDPTDPALIDRRPFTVALHAKVKSSPVIIDGRAWGADYAVTAVGPTLGPAPVPVSRISDKDFFIDLPLEPKGKTEVTFSQEGVPAPTTISGKIAWVPVAMHRDEAITIRTGDSIKLRCRSSCGEDAVVIDADDDDVVDYRGTSSDVFIHRYDVPGVYVARAWNAAGDQVGTVTVTVAAVRLPEAIACELGYTRTVDLHTGIHDPAGLVVTANDPSLLAVTRGAADGAHLRVTLKPLGRGDLVLQVRQGSAAGPIIAARAVDEFLIDRSEMQHVAVNMDTCGGTLVLAIRPHVPDLDVVFVMFASQASFGDGPDMRVSTNHFRVEDDPATGETVGSFDVDLAIPPAETSYCMRTSFEQPNQQWVQVGCESSNGKKCQFAIDPVKILAGTQRDIPLIKVHKDNKEWKKKGTHKEGHWHEVGAGMVTVKKIKQQVKGKKVVVEQETFTKEGELQIAPNLYDCLKGPDQPAPADGHRWWCRDGQEPYYIACGAKVKQGKYHVQICNTIFKDKIEVVKEAACTFALTTTPDTCGKDKLYYRMVFAKAPEEGAKPVVERESSVAIHCTLTKHDPNCSGLHALTVSGGKWKQTYSVSCPGAKGKTVDQKVETFKRDVGKYTAKIANTTQKNIFQIHERQTLNAALKAADKEPSLPGSVKTGGIKTTNFATLAAPAGQFKAQVTFQYQTGPIVNEANPGGKKAWAAAQQAKAPADELYQWELARKAVQDHEEGHVTVWETIQKSYGLTPTVQGPLNGKTEGQAIQDAIQDLIDEIQAAEKTAQEAYHKKIGSVIIFEVYDIYGRE